MELGNRCIPVALLCRCNREVTERSGPFHSAALLLQLDKSRLVLLRVFRIGLAQGAEQAVERLTVIWIRFEGALPSLDRLAAYADRLQALPEKERCFGVSRIELQRFAQSRNRFVVML